MHRLIGVFLFIALAAAGCSQGVSGRAESSSPPVAVDLSPRAMKLEAKSATESSDKAKAEESAASGEEQPAAEESAEAKK